jgi:SAM-dependent methyltransferase
VSAAHEVMWHDVECGSYAADLPLWHELALVTGGRVLDVGAGTGRVALRLAAAGHAVTALDRDPRLLATLRERARRAGLDVRTLTADAASFDTGGERFGLVAVPMQTIQLLSDRAGFFASARRAVAPGGLVALAIADALEGFEPGAAMPAPDRGEAAGWRYVSQPTAVREVPGAVRIERLRERIAPDGARTVEDDVIELARLDEAALAAEGATAGLRPEAGRRIAATEAHVGSTVVVLRG